ncbi:molybdopterin molybdenumtransferase [Campylobacter pinnipediorum subsp. pinnipediorum]|uniref:molybdopterin molybdotransferase MoeA n=1 Tax=Campylobacter pinnipediorum TaxID=1965231 RepID=UPI00084D7F76|nr:molybdopterin molybdotransferase MoeA [Campylobacter pinnipediorum]AQW81034.1 molybdopterin molybdenumtransferase [Campylobacter pinnipediorum subsp. pinnipediorum]
MVELNEVFEILKSNETLDECIALENALGKITSQDIVAIKDLPCFDNSALDGFAIKFDQKENGYTLIDTVFAGETKKTQIKDNECIKIMTGAIFPLGADTILRIEDSIEKDGKIYPKNPEKLKKGDAHRFKGEEVTIGNVLIKKGTKLEPTHIMLLASQGIYNVKVKPNPKIAIFSSGNELKEPWEFANETQIYNANALGISSLLQKNGFNSSYFGIIKDDLGQTINSLKNTSNFDVVICSGGASMGDADFMKMALDKLGYTQIFDKINLRPGAPTKAYKKDNQTVFILPGNPMAAYICNLIVVVPFLNNSKPEMIKCISGENIKFKKGRANVVLGNLQDGKFYSLNNNKYGSGMITPLTQSDFIYISNPSDEQIMQDQEIYIMKIS